MSDKQDKMNKNYSECPLITFALLAYNQESYIREAVEGAFAQNYSPLEIILSDDYSTDKTYEIMKDLVDEYKGFHIIKINRNGISVPAKVGHAALAVAVCFMAMVCFLAFLSFLNNL